RSTPLSSHHYSLSLPVALPISLSSDMPKVPPIESPDPLDHVQVLKRVDYLCQQMGEACLSRAVPTAIEAAQRQVVSVRREYLARSEEHTSELQSLENLVCRLLL